MKQNTTLVKKRMNSDIKLVKLKSGEELIGDVTVVGDSVTIANPCQIMPTQDGLGFAPWPPFSKNDNVTINKDWIIDRKSVV